jgi:hypothetical protein
VIDEAIVDAMRDVAERYALEHHNRVVIAVAPAGEDVQDVFRRLIDDFDPTLAPLRKEREQAHAAVGRSPMSSKSLGDLRSLRT